MESNGKMASRIEIWEVGTLKPYQKNARTHSAIQVNEIVESIREFGFTNPILVDEDNGIIAGHGRLLAAKKLGMLKVPVVPLTHLTPSQKRAYVIADNKLALNAGWDDDILKAELAALKSEDFDIKLTGFSDEELDCLISEESSPRDKDDLYSKEIKAPIYEPTEKEQPKINKLYDCSTASELIKEINESSASEELKEFLIAAASRHVVFSYKTIAEFYAHSNKDVQNLFEKSALVIIDYNKAIENGFTVMTDKLCAEYEEQDG